MWVDSLPFSSCPGHPSAVEVCVGCVILVGKDPPEQRIGIFLEVGQARRFCEMVCMEQENVRTTEHRKLTNLISGTDRKVLDLL